MPSVERLVEIESLKALLEGLPGGLVVTVHALDGRPLATFTLAPDGQNGQCPPNGQAVTSLHGQAGTSPNGQADRLPPPRGTPRLPPERLGEHACRKQIRRVLHDAGRRLLLREIMDEFAERGIEWTDRTVQKYVSEMQADGQVDRNDEVSPPGYGLVE